MNNSFNYLIEESIKNNWELLALTDFNGPSFQYKDVARKIAKLHILFEHTGIKPGDKIAFCGKNSANWAMAFISAITYGAVPVPILHEFKPDNIHHIVNHSDAKILFIDNSIWENLDHSQLKQLYGVLSINDYSLIQAYNEQITYARKHLNEMFGHKYPERFLSSDVQYYKDKPEELAVINYTSGSTGFSKGVMLPYRSLYGNATFCINNLHFLKAGDGVICMLPLAHMYGLMIEMLHTFIKGCHLHFLTRVPSPRIIMEAFETVKPKLIITVPLIIEKIIKTRVFPLLEKPYMKLMLKVPFVDEHLLLKIKEKLTITFGGNLCELIVGGAALNPDVDKFLHKINFPLTVGYGMTECGPLLAYAPWNENRPGACGKLIDGMQLKVDSSDPANIVGELWVKGCNTMLGYYKNDAATAETFADGWMRTGDLCNVDEDNFIYLRGRNKNMILGPSGQNIYPEEIEAKLNNLPYVCESIVIDDDGALKALVYPDMELLQNEGIEMSNVGNIMNENISTLNKELPNYSQIKALKIYYEEFEKTPKRSIKRYLYM